MGVTTTDLRVAVTVIHPIALVSTAFRLGYRWRRKRFWWDDALAAASMVFDLVFLIAIWIRTDGPGVGPLVQPPGARIASYWIVSVTFTLILWSARISILLSIVRLVPPMMTMRRFTLLLLLVFPLITVGLLVQKIYHCASNLAWYHAPGLQCHLGRDVAIAELCTDVFADGTLVLIPLRLLWGVRLPRKQRQLLFTVFCTSLVTTIVSIPHAIYVMGVAGLYEGITAHIEAGVSLVVANLLVITTYLYTVFRNGENIDDYADAPTAPTMSVRIPRTRSTFPDSFDLRFFSFGRGRDTADAEGAGTRNKSVALSAVDGSAEEEAFGGKADRDHKRDLSA